MSALCHTFIHDFYKLTHHPFLQEDNSHESHPFSMFTLIFFLIYSEVFLQDLTVKISKPLTWFWVWNFILHKPKEITRPGGINIREFPCSCFLGKQLMYFRCLLIFRVLLYSWHLVLLRRLFIIHTNVLNYVIIKYSKMSSCVSVVKHCVSSAKGCWFNSQGTNILIKKNIYILNKISFG